MKTISLRKVEWNNDKHQYEPGEIICEVPGSVEVAPGKIEVTLLTPLTLSAGEQYYLVLPLDEELHAYRLPVERSVVSRRIHIRADGEAPIEG